MEEKGTWRTWNIWLKGKMRFVARTVNKLNFIYYLFYRLLLLEIFHILNFSPVRMPRPNSLILIDRNVDQTKQRKTSCWSYRPSAGYPADTADNRCITTISWINRMICNHRRRTGREEGGSSPGWASQGGKLPPPWRFGHSDVIKIKNWKVYPEGGKNHAKGGGKIIPPWPVLRPWTET